MNDTRPTAAQVFSRWAVRGLLAALLLVSHELLVWANLASLPPEEWLIRLTAYPILAALMLDIAARYRIRDVYDGMALLAIYSLIAGLLISPQSSFADFPRTLVTRVLGAYNLTGAVGFGLFLTLTAGHVRQYRWRLLLGMGWVGFYWGTWLRWTPELGTQFSGPVALATMLTTAGGLYLVPFILWRVMLRAPHQPMPDEFRLPLVPGLLAVLVLVVLFMLRAAQNLLDGTGLFVSLVLMVICLAILWFRRAPKGDTLLGAHLPPTPLALIWVIATIIIFSGTTIMAYSLPLVGTPVYNQFWLMDLGYVGVGIIWLPLLASVIAIRGIDRQMRTREFES